MNLIERKAEFELELNALLKKFDCELEVDNIDSSGWRIDCDTITVNFNWNEKDFEGIENIDPYPSSLLVLGRWISGK